MVQLSGFSTQGWILTCYYLLHSLFNSHSFLKSTNTYRNPYFILWGWWPVFFFFQTKPWCASHQSSGSSKIWLFYYHFLYNPCVLFFSLLLKLGEESKWSTWTWHHRRFSCTTKDSNISGTYFKDIHQGYMW